MTSGELTTRVTLDTCAVVGALAAIAAWPGGTAAGMGVLAGGILAGGDFPWLGARARLGNRARGGSARAWLNWAGGPVAAFGGARPPPLSHRLGAPIPPPAPV